MKKTMTRKIVLLSLIAVFLCIYILQLAFTGKSKAKEVTLETQPDSILIVKGGEEANANNSIRVVQENGSWFVAEKKYPADSSVAIKMADGVKSIKLLGEITSNASSAEKYGLGDSEKITVTGFKDGKSVRTITVGKDTTSGGQCYVQVDGKGTIYMAEGALHGTYSSTVDAIRSKQVYTSSADEVSSVTVTTKDGAYSVQKQMPQADLTAASEDKKADDKKSKEEKKSETVAAKPAWTLSQNTTSVKSNAVDEETTTSWAKSLANLNVSSWAADDAKLPSTEPASTVRIAAGAKEYTVAVYEIPGSSEDEDAKYLCSSSATPYLFYITQYNAKKYMKPLSDLSKK
ncbi:MAG: DUF4340 domain-containing protein [Treponema sp.]